MRMAGREARPTWRFGEDGGRDARPTWMLAPPAGVGGRLTMAADYASLSTVALRLAGAREFLATLMASVGPDVSDGGKSVSYQAVQTQITSVRSDIDIYMRQLAVEQRRRGGGVTFSRATAM